jgi:hypothetical protein
MSRPSCIACGVNAAASSCQRQHQHQHQHSQHAGAEHRNCTFSIFPDLHDQLGMLHQGGLHEFQFFGQSDHKSVAWLFDDDPPPTVGDDRSPDENHRSCQRPSTFHPFGRQYHPGNGLTFEVPLDQREVDAAELGLAGGGGQVTESSASATMVSSGPKESPIGSLRFGVLYAFSCIIRISLAFCC